MASETGREEFGETSRGFVVVITKQSETDGTLFVVRHGTQTVMETSNHVAAVTVARALVKG